MALLLLLIYTQLDGKMEINLEGCTKKYNNEESKYTLKCLFLVDYVLSMCCLSLVYVFSMSFLCVVYVLSMCCLCVVYVM